MFHNSTNVVITGGQFINIENNQDNDVVTSTLMHHVATGAIFDSAEQYSAGQCHPGTRKQILELMTTWTQNPDIIQERVLWLYGSAGAGKSALMQTLCNILKDLKPNMYAGSFFFARGHAERGKAVKLFVTLSYQLAVHFPFLRKELNDILRHDSTLPTKSIDIQLRSLIINPILRCKDLLSHVPILVIDGLDECDDENGYENQRRIITLISNSLIDHDIPIRFIIASRAEYWIRDTFETSPACDITAPLSLRDDFDADADIRLYLTEEFESIRLQNLRIMGSVEKPWPPTKIIDRFVEEASGQYLYATTVLKFVGKGSRFNDPQKQLRIITTPGPHRASAFTELDRLYATILSAYPNRETMKRVLVPILYTKFPLCIVEGIYGVEKTEIMLVLDALSALVDIIPSQPVKRTESLLVPIFGPLLAGEDKINLCHLSFREFLQDATRSGPYHLNFDDIQKDGFSACFAAIHNNLEQNYETEPHVSLNIDIMAYSNMMLVMNNFWATGAGGQTKSEALIPLLNNMKERLQNIDPNRQMKHPECFVQDMVWIWIITRKSNPILDMAGRGFTPSVLSALLELGDAAFLAWNHGRRMILSNKNFKVTPTLCFVDALGGTQVPLKQLFTVPGISVDETVSALRENRHTISLFRDSGLEWVVCLFGRLPELGMVVNYQGASQWSTGNHRVSLVFECLKSLMYTVDNDWEYISDVLQPEKVDMKPMLLGKFFDDGAMSDIRGEEYFDNQLNVNLLTLILDTEAWTKVLPFRSQLWTILPGLVTPVLCWLNRHLTNPHTVKVLKGYDTHLPDKMTKAMNVIFERCFVPAFTTPYFTEPLLSSSPTFEHKKPQITVRLRTMPTMMDLDRESVYTPPEDHSATLFHRVQSELFDTPTSRSPVPPTRPVIDPMSWYPHLAAYLLNTMVKHGCCRYVPDNFSLDAIAKKENVDRSFAYIIQCLPYAQTTQHNLDALRALKGFYPRLDQHRQFKPPQGFCSLTLDFLTRYKSSALSSDEMRSFGLWLSSLEEVKRERLEPEERPEIDNGLPEAMYRFSCLV